MNFENKILIDEKNSKKRLDVFLCEFFKNRHTRSQINTLINEKMFSVNSKFQKSSYKLKKDDKITFNSNEIDNFLNKSLILEPFDYKLDILFEDDELLVINKPKNMLTHPTKFDNKETLVNALIYHCKGNLSDLSGKNRLGIVHRLDKNTSGLIICAKTNFSHKILQEQIGKKIAKRKYLALAIGNFETKEGIIDKDLAHYIKDNVKMNVVEKGKGQEAITLYKVKEEFKDVTMVELELKTGRTHQIRAHLAYLNHPIIGDSLYGAKGFLAEYLRNFKTQEQLLVSYYLSFYHPKTNELMEFQLKEKDFSKDFIKVLNFLRSKK